MLYIQASASNLDTEYINTALTDTLTIECDYPGACDDGQGGYTSTTVMGTNLNVYLSLNPVVLLGLDVDPNVTVNMVVGTGSTIVGSIGQNDTQHFYVRLNAQSDTTSTLVSFNVTADENEGSPGGWYFNHSDYIYYNNLAVIYADETQAADVLQVLAMPYIYPDTFFWISITDVTHPNTVFTDTAPLIVLQFHDTTQHALTMTVQNYAVGIAEQQDGTFTLQNNGSYLANVRVSTYKAALKLSSASLPYITDGAGRGDSANLNVLLSFWDINSNAIPICTDGDSSGVRLYSDSALTTLLTATSEHLGYTVMGFVLNASNYSDDQTPVAYINFANVDRGIDTVYMNGTITVDAENTDYTRANEMTIELAQFNIRDMGRGLGGPFNHIMLSNWIITQTDDVHPKLKFLYVGNNNNTEYDQGYDYVVQHDNTGDASGAITIYCNAGTE